MGAPLLVGLVTFAVAAWSASLDVHWLDTGELTAAGLWLGIPHPPGHPLYVLLSHLAGLLPLGTGPVRISWASALALALVWGTSCWIAQRLLERWLGLGSRLAGWLAALPALGGSLAGASLMQGVRAEVYALHAALLLAALGLLLVGRPGMRLRLTAVLLGALALANHHFLVFLALGGLVAAWAGSWWAEHGRSCVAGHGGWRRPVAGILRRELPLALLGLLVGLTPYLFLPLRAISATPLVWGDPRTPERFYWVLSAQVFQKSLRVGPLEALHNLGQAWLLLMEPLHPLGFVAAVVGVGLLARRRLAAAAALLLVATGTALSQSLVSSDDIDPFNPDLHGYFLAAQAVLAITVACCAGWLARAVSAVQERTAALSARAVRLVQVLLLALLACLPLRSLCLAGEPLAFARLRAPEIVARAILDPLPPHAVAVTSDFSTVFLLWSAQAAGEARPDVAVVHRNYLPFPGWVEREARFQPDLLPLLRLLRHPDAAFDPALGPPLRRPLYVEPYHNLGAAIAAGLRPAGLLHRWEPGGARPGEAQPRFWQEIYHRLGPADLADPQTRRYLFWQHVLQGQQYRASGAPAAALQELERALALAPESPEVLAMAGELRGREPSPPADPSRQLRPGTGRHLPPRR